MDAGDDEVVWFAVVSRKEIYPRVSRTGEMDGIGRRLRLADARAFRFAIPRQVMTSLFPLGLNANSRVGQRVFDWLLPVVACVFVFASIPRRLADPRRRIPRR